MHHAGRSMDGTPAAQSDRLVANILSMQVENRAVNTFLFYILQLANVMSTAYPPKVINILINTKWNRGSFMLGRST